MECVFSLAINTGLLPNPMGNSEAKHRASPITPSSGDSVSSLSMQFANSARPDDPPNPEPSSGKKQEQAAEKDEYPRRSGLLNCAYYVKFGSCKYGMNCEFNHPPKPSGRPDPAGEMQQKQEEAPAEPEYLWRPGEPDCAYYVKFGSCKYGMNCKFNHRPKPSGWPVEGRDTNSSNGNEAPSSEYKQMAYSMLTDISQERQHWRVRVRITRLWETREPKILQRITRKNFVMLDEQGRTMEGYIPRAQVDRFADAIVDDHVYYIEHFEVTEAKDQYRAVDNYLQARFTRWTKATEVHPVPQRFPMFAYKLRTFREILGRLDDKTCLADVIGLITFIGDVAMVNSKGQLKPRRQIRLNDGRDNATLALWEADAQNFDAQGLYHTSKRELIVAIFAGCTFKLHKGKLSLSASYGCKQYINVRNPDIVDFQNRVARTRYEIQRIGVGTHVAQQADAIETTISELALLNPHDILNQRYVCEATIKGLAPDDKWWYLSCGTCRRKSIAHRDSYKCTKCPNKTAEPRYKLALEATDGKSIVEFIFFGDIATALVGKPAIVLVGATHASSTSVPSEITTLFGRTYVLEATVSRGSFQRDNISFQVSRIYRDPPMLPATHDAGIGSAGTSSSSQAALSDHQQTSDIPMVENIGNIISPAITKLHQQGMPVESTTLQITPAKPTDFTAAQEGIPIPCPSMMMASPVSLMPPVNPTEQQVSESYMEPPSVPLSNHPSKSISMAPSAEPCSQLTPMQPAEKRLAIQKTTPLEIEGVAPHTASKRRYSGGISKTAKKLFKDDDGKPITARPR